MPYKKILSVVFGEVWAIRPCKLDALANLVMLVAGGGKRSEEELAEIAAVRRGRPAAVKGSVAVLPVHGLLSQHAGMIQESSGGTSTDELGRAFDSLMADNSIGAVVLDVDSPGGSVYGITELSSRIRAARGTKPIVAVANSEMASAAYHLGTAADEMVVTPSGEVGSVGVVALHLDVSKAAEMSGLSYTLLSAGEHKADGNSFQPLTDSSRAELQGQVDRYYEMFVGDVAKNRGITVKAVKSGYGQGRMVGAREAVESGMADRIDTLENVVAGLLSRQPKSVGAGRTASDMRRRLALKIA